MSGAGDSGRIIALDIGKVRIGVAASDPTGTFASPVTVLKASGNWMDDLAGIIEKYDAVKLLVGLPCRTDGSEGPEAKTVRHVISRLSDRFPDMEILAWDERFTTVIAASALLEADVSRAGRKGRVDKVAASVLLQSYLDSGRPVRIMNNNLIRERGAPA